MAGRRVGAFKVASEATFLEASEATFLEASEATFLEASEATFLAVFAVLAPPTLEGGRIGPPMLERAEAHHELLHWVEARRLVGAMVGAMDVRRERAQRSLCQWRGGCGEVTQRSLCQWWGGCGEVTRRRLGAADALCHLGQRGRKATQQRRRSWAQRRRQHSARDDAQRRRQHRARDDAQRISRLVHGNQRGRPRGGRRRGRGVREDVRERCLVRWAIRPRIDVARIDVTRIDVAHIDVARIDVTRMDVARIDVTRIDVTRVRRRHGRVCSFITTS